MLTVSEKAIDQATKCINYFDCLSMKTRRICKVEPLPDSDQLVCAGKPEEVMCKYRKPFRHVHVCSCPVRKELYNRYGI